MAPAAVVDGLLQLAKLWSKAWLLYFAMADSMLSVAINLGLLPQFVFVPYLADGAGAWAFLAQLVAYPLLIGFSAIKAQYLMNIVTESFSQDPLKETRDTIAAAFGIQSEESKDKITLLLHVALSIGFVTSLGLAYYFTAAGVDLGFITGFLEGSLLTTTVLSYLFLTAEIVRFLRTRGDPQDKGYLSLEAGPTLPDDRNLMIIGLVIFIFVQIGVGSLVWWEIVDGSNLVLSTVAGIAAIGTVFHKLFGRMLQPLPLCPFTSCFSLVIVLAALTGILTTWLPYAIFGDDPYFQLEETFFEPAPAGSTFNTSHRAPGTELGYGAYPICNLMQWERLQPLDGTQLLALDLIVFAEASWFNSSEDIMTEVTNMSRNTDLGKVELEFLASVRQIGRVVSFRLPDIKKRVIVIRGSSLLADWLFNLDIWTPAVFFSLVRAALPFGSAIPSSFVHQFLSFDVRRALNLPAPWEPMRDQIRELKAQSQKDGFDLVLTGMSLGGGMAAMLGSVEGIQTLAIAPAGSAMTQYRVTGGFVKETVPIENTVVELTPWGDPFPLLFDQQDGMVQKIACTSFNPWTCHSNKQIICELGRKCGDPRGRSLQRHCSKQVGEDWEQIPWKRFAWHSFF